MWLKLIKFCSRMAFTFAAFCYIAALILTAVLIFFAIWHLIAFDELQHDYKNPVDQCNSLNPLVIPEYTCHAVILCLMFFSSEITSAVLNIPLTTESQILMINARQFFSPSRISSTRAQMKAKISGWTSCARESSRDDHMLTLNASYKSLDFRRILWFCRKPVEIFNFS